MMAFPAFFKWDFTFLLCTHRCCKRLQCVGTILARERVTFSEQFSQRVPKAFERGTPLGRQTPSDKRPCEGKARGKKKKAHTSALEMWEYTVRFLFQYQPFPSGTGEVCWPGAALLLRSVQLRKVSPNLFCDYTTSTCSCSSSSYPWQTGNFHTSATVWKIKPLVMTKPLLPFPNHSVSITI